MRQRCDGRTRHACRWIHVALLAGALCLAESASADDCTFSAEVLDAAASNRDVKTAGRLLEAKGYEATRRECVELGGGCGFAGCAAVVLVVQGFQTPGVNPQSDSVLARVTLAPTGELVSVERVNLAAMRTTERLSHPLETKSLQRREPAALHSEPQIRERIAPKPVEIQRPDEDPQ